MRKDTGVDGDAQRLSQIVWMLFLKIFADKEVEAEINGETALYADTEFVESDAFQVLDDVTEA